MARPPSGPRKVAPALCFGHYLRARRLTKNNKTTNGALLEEQ
jgi:hypothetical protein